MGIPSCGLPVTTQDVSMLSFGQACLQRFDFTPPGDFLRMVDGNVLPRLPGFHWMTPDEILHFEFLDHQWPDFIPFGRNEEGDLWCWCPGMESGSGIPVGICPVNCEEGEIYAPHFASALFRLFCDAAQSLASAPSGHSAASALLHKAADLTGPGWPVEWNAWLRRMAEYPPSSWRTQDGPRSGIIPPEEHARVIREWIDDGEVGSVFRWMTAP